MENSRQIIFRWKQLFSFNFFFIHVKGGLIQIAFYYTHTF